MSKTDTTFKGLVSGLLFYGPLLLFSIDRFGLCRKFSSHTIVYFIVFVILGLLVYSLSGHIGQLSNILTCVLILDMELLLASYLYNLGIVCAYWLLVVILLGVVGTLTFKYLE